MMALLFSFQIRKLFSCSKTRAFKSFRQFNLYSSEREFDFDGDINQSREKPKGPTRQDVFSIFFSGVVGVEPKEAHLKSGHYVKNFPVTFFICFSRVLTEPPSCAAGSSRTL